MSLLFGSGFANLPIATSWQSSLYKPLSFNSFSKGSLNPLTFVKAAAAAPSAEAIYKNYNDEIGLTPIPDDSNRSLQFDYYIINTDLSGSTDTSVIPTRFENVIIERAKYYAYTLRGDVQNAQQAQIQFDKSKKRMRVE